MPRVVNRAKMTTASTGTGALTLGAASAGYQTFAAAGVGDGETVRYVVEDGVAWEVGLGVYSASGPTLSRGPTESSAAGAAISASGSGTTVYVTAAAADLGLDPLPPPVAANFSWVNQGGWTRAADANGALVLSGPSAGGENFVLQVAALPAPPFRYRTRLRLLCPGMGVVQAAPVVRNSTSGAFIAFGQRSDGASLRVMEWSSPTSGGGDEFTSIPNNYQTVPEWYEYEESTTTRYYRCSWDGVNFFQLGSVGRTTFIAADQVGFGVNANAGATSYTLLAKVPGWRRVA